MKQTFAPVMVFLFCHHGACPIWQLGTRSDVSISPSSYSARIGCSRELVICLRSRSPSAAPLAQPHLECNPHSHNGSALKCGVLES